jgi:hypothetical protein
MFSFGCTRIELYPGFLAGEARKVYNLGGATCAAFIREREEYYEIYSRQNTVLPPLG